MTTEAIGKKPKWRGHIHQEAFFVALGACLLMTLKTGDRLSFLGSTIYSIGLLSLLGISGLYHRIYWQPKTRAFLRKLDHSAIFLLIAGTFTPICLLVLSREDGFFLLCLVWSAATLGIVQALFWVKAPRWLTSLFYVVLGWFALPYVRDLQSNLGSINFGLLLTGGIFYSLGALGYALKRPKLNPLYFGYHEFFHVLTVIAALLHFVVISQILR